MGADKEADRYAESWKYNIPAIVKVFWYLLLKNRLLTHDNMFRRQMACSLPCVLCDNCPVESGFHIFFLCPYVVHVWFLLGRRAGFKLVTLGQDLLSTWDSTRHPIRRKGGEWKHKGIVLIVCACGRCHSNARLLIRISRFASSLPHQMWQERRSMVELVITFMPNVDFFVRNVPNCTC